MTTITCEHCESEIDIEQDPHCIQDGGMDVMCAGCREQAWERWRQDTLKNWRQPEAYRIKRGWRA